MTVRRASLILSILALLIAVFVACLVAARRNQADVDPLLIAAARGLSKMGFGQLVISPGQSDCPAPAQGFAFHGMRHGQQSTGEICIHRIPNGFQAVISIDDDDADGDRS